MTDMSSELFPENGRTVRITRWEFRGLVLEAFLLVGCLSALLGLARHGSAALSTGFVVAAVTLLAPLALFPIISIAARVYYHMQIRGGRTILWFLVVAAAAAVIVFFVHW